MSHHASQKRFAAESEQHASSCLIRKKSALAKWIHVLVFFTESPAHALMVGHG
jgi:hypothetical protein